MAKITITEIDSTIRGLSTTTVDNVVFVPGTAITGPSVPTLCQSYSEFTSIFGDTPPKEDLSTNMCNWEYAANLLIAGLPVLFRRVTGNKLAGSNVAGDGDDNSLVGFATAPITVTSGADTVDVGTVSAKYGGSYGNRIEFQFVRNTRSIYLSLRLKYSLGSTSDTRQIESIKLIDIADGESEETIKSNLINSIKTTFDSNYVKINITDEDKFNITSTTSFVYLTGGTDANNTEASKAAADPSGLYNELRDKMIYDVKFITSGGWTDFSTTDNFYNFSGIMAGQETYGGNESIVKDRQDCVAILDIPQETPSDQVKTYFDGSVNGININTSYAAAYAPWALMTLETGGNKWCPPSFVFLKTLANSLKSGNKIWFPPAGVRRATIGDIVDTQYPVGSSLLDQWQNNSTQYINPIMRLRQYGYVIYGQRTLMRSVDGSTDKRSALQELGVRITANEIKRRINDIALQLTFEQNNIHTWNEFRGLLDPFMSQLLNDGALYSYEIIMDETTTTSSDIDENRIVGVVRANITRAAEDFEIGFELTASSVVLSES